MDCSKMKAGIAIDPWKLKIFKKGLDDAGYEYEVFEGSKITTINVTAKFSDTLKLQNLIKDLQIAAVKSKMN